MKSHLSIRSFSASYNLSCVGGGRLVWMLVMGMMTLGSLEAQLSTPTSLKATLNNGQVTLTWQPVSGATSYNIYVGTSSGGETFAYNDSTSPGSSTVTSMANGTKYYFEVTATNSSGESARSPEVSATPLAAPLDLSATANNGQVTLAWQPVSGATSYSLYGGTSSSGKAIITSVGGISYIDTGLSQWRHVLF